MRPSAAKSPCLQAAFEQAGPAFGRHDGPAFLTAEPSTAFRHSLALTSCSRFKQLASWGVAASLLQASGCGTGCEALSAV